VPHEAATIREASEIGFNRRAPLTSSSAPRPLDDQYLDLHLTTTRSQRRVFFSPIARETREGIVDTILSAK